MNDLGPSRKRMETRRQKRTVEMNSQSTLRQTLSWAGSVWLLAAVPMGAQEIIELPTEDRTLELEFEELYRLGTLDGEEWEQFGDVQSVAFAAAGTLLVLRPARPGPEDLCCGSRGSVSA